MVITKSVESDYDDREERFNGNDITMDIKRREEEYVGWRSLQHGHHTWYSWDKYDPLQDSHLDDFATRFGHLKRKDGRRIKAGIDWRGEIYSEDSPAIAAGIYSPSDWDSEQSWDTDLMAPGAMPSCTRDFDKVITQLKATYLNEKNNAKRERIADLVEMEERARAEFGEVSEE